MKVLTNISGNITNANWSGPAQQTTIIFADNPKYLRQVLLTTNGIIVKRLASTVGIDFASLVECACGMEPGIGYAPMVTVQPRGASINSASSVSFNVTFKNDPWVVPVYAWQNTTPNGANYSNISNVSPYSGMATNILSINPVAGLDNTKYRCLIYNASGNSVSDSATLQVT